ncbi:uncharacterized protein K452DRAFT_321565 [Aplosporella prunicola CBS 121167]|uniref:Invertebrate defensins family profile domain-containing protein n=1 Tax=Aplosporella prunicola CBS 121167 TaxID=1176127 RepID=A0A6A6B4R1_9PEZI|nr:uncharacterized protein K452DRAFT_321565 [Aplosporella prunicola CBS 121167]KAF2137947.1 hypothetical protein K452DRAFT_321565 [Aplosporella prunicola CBS 121167]
MRFHTATLLCLISAVLARPVPADIKGVRSPTSYSQDLLSPVLCPPTGTGTCARQCGAIVAGMGGRCDSDGNCLCADGEGPLR